MQLQTSKAGGDVENLHKLVGVVVVAIIIVGVGRTVTVQIVIIGIIIILGIVVGVHTRLFRVRNGGGKLVRLLSAEPRVEERERIGLVVRAVGLSTDGESLTIVLWQETGTFATLSEKVLHGEVGKRQAHAGLYVGREATEVLIAFVETVGPKVQLVGGFQVYHSPRKFINAAFGGGLRLIVGVVLFLVGSAVVEQF